MAFSVSNTPPAGLLGVNASGHAAPFEQPGVKASDILINRPEPAVSEEDTADR
jgi:hypothetical protein